MRRTLESLCVSQLFVLFANILLPVFVLVLVGYIVGPRLQLDARTLSRFAYFIITPSFTFNIFSAAHIQVTLALRMAIFIIVVTTGTVVVAWLTARAMRCSPQMTAAYVLVAAFGNVGNFGIPIIQFRLGEEALVAASFYFLILSIYGFMVGVTAATWHQGTGLRAIWMAFKTPAVLAVIPAFVVNWFDVALPLFITRAVGLLAGALIPVMLVTLGVQLAGMGIPKLDRDIVVTSLVRLLVGPVLALLLVAPFALTGIERGAGILQASMPVAVLAALIAFEHQLLPNFVTTVTLFSTLASAITLTVVLTFV
ncbi:MAG: AEC family transporter [Caldilineaceae bacterium]|nr:AEC family transporter [Caldilineaceae bacterium]